MRKVVRSPLTWMVLAELVVVAALIGVAWTVVAAASRPAMASPAVAPPNSTDDVDYPLAEPPNVKPGVRGPMPGLNLDSAFWRERLRQLNRDQAFFVELEWRIVHGAMDAARHYLETVVLPAVQRAERAGVESVT